jgi:hypothetical protein
MYNYYETALYVQDMYGINELLDAYVYMINIQEHNDELMDQLDPLNHEDIEIIESMLMRTLEQLGIIVPEDNPDKIYDIIPAQYFPSGLQNDNDIADMLRWLFQIDPILREIGRRIFAFKHLPANEQLEYLEGQILDARYKSNSERGRLANQLRGMRESMKLDQLFMLSSVFMNETLRDFMNLNDDGTTTYDYDIIMGNRDKWQLNEANLYHIDPAYKVIKKYEDNEGREVVFGSNDERSWHLITNDLYRGTYNYSPSGYRPPIGYINHFLYDMLPYFQKHPQTILDTIPGLREKLVELHEELLDEKSMLEYLGGLAYEELKNLLEPYVEQYLYPLIE